MTRPKLKVLLVSLFHPELVRGGAQLVCYDQFMELRGRDDVEATLLAAVDQNLPALFKSGARIIGFDGRPAEFLFLGRGYDYQWHRLPDPVMIEAFEEFLCTVQPDVVHFHHFMMLGIDMLSFTRRVLPRARIVLTLHEYLAICAADGQMVRTADRSLCTRASAVRCHQCFPNWPPEHFFLRRMWIEKHFQAVDVFTSPSRFLRDRYVAWGLDPRRIVEVTNGQVDRARPMPPRPAGPANRFGFFGQLVDGKGIHIILQAVALLRAEGFEDFIVEINGENLRFASPRRRAEIEAFQAAEEALPVEEQRVLFNGGYHPDELHRRMARIDWVIMASVWWENAPLVIPEAWSFGRPVIVSDVGGMAERVTDGVDGLHFAMGDARALAACMRRACTEEGLWEELAGGIAAPPGAREMTDAFLDVYMDLSEDAGVTA